MVELSQYFKIIASSPKKAKKQVSYDLTSHIEEGVSMTEEDGLIKECSFDLMDGYLYMDILYIGYVINLFGGTLDKNDFIFNGYIKSMDINFSQSGDVILKVNCYSAEGQSLGVGIGSEVYPNKKDKRSWNNKELMYSDIICNLAKEADFRVDAENINVKHDLKASFNKGSVSQNNITDWAFIQKLAEKIKCTVWTEERNGTSYLYLEDNTSLVNTVSRTTLFYPTKISKTEFSESSYNNENKIQLLEVKINLDTKNSSGQFKQMKAKNSKGEDITQTYTDKPKLDDDGKDTGITERWVLDEGKLKGLSDEKRQELMELFMSGKIDWEGGDGKTAAKDYFILYRSDISSREGVPNNIEVTNIKDDGTKEKENTGSKSFKTVIDSGKLKELSSEKRSAIMGRIIRGEMTDEDKQYYKTVDTTPKEDKDDAKNKNTGGSQNTQAGVDKSGKKPRKDSIKTDDNTEKQKRDDGFNITCKCYGDDRLKARRSYLIEGIGKYSGIYYLYKIKRSWGKSGYMMDELVFTK